MKLQISVDIPNLEKALEIAAQIAPHTDTLVVGNLLIYYYGAQAVKAFKDAFSKKTIVADTKIVDRGKEAVTCFVQAGADWVTVMAGTSKDIIHAACSTAEKNNVKVILDLLDASSLGQSALEAENLGASAILFHKPLEETESLTFIDRWDMIKGNTNLPVFVSGRIRRETLEEMLTLKPHGIMVGKSIVDAENPAQEAQYFQEICSKN